MTDNDTDNDNDNDNDIEIPADNEPLELHERHALNSTVRLVDLSLSTFHQVRLRNSRIGDADLSGLTVHEAYVDRMVFTGVEGQRVRIDGDIGELVVNGIDVMPFVESELVRRYPEYALMKPDDPAGFAKAWDTVQSFWGTTVSRARSLDESLLHESVDGEWSFIQTLRHLVMATESWVYRGILGEMRPWLPLSLPWDGMPPTEGVPHDRDARPSLEEVLEMRLDRMATVRRVIDGLTAEQLASDGPELTGAGWPPAGERFPVRESLLTVLNEEWWHHRFAVRDLEVLTAR